VPRKKKPVEQHVVDLGYRPRPWQLEVHRKMKRFSVVVAHRRSGKTVLACRTLVAAALACKTPRARFAYLAPFLKQARSCSWDLLRTFTRDVPGVTVHEVVSKISFAHNGAVIELFGQDSPDQNRGAGWSGAVMDEVSQTRPRSWGEVVRPALTDSRGCGLFIGTPAGVNAFSEIYHKALDDDEWYATRLTHADTGAIPVDEIEQARRSMSAAQFAQEFECSFSAAVEDA